MQINSTVIDDSLWIICNVRNDFQTAKTISLYFLLRKLRNTKKDYVSLCSQCIKTSPCHCLNGNEEKKCQDLHGCFSPKCPGSAFRKMDPQSNQGTHSPTNEHGSPLYCWCVEHWKQTHPHCSIWYIQRLNITNEITDKAPNENSEYPDTLCTTVAALVLHRWQYWVCSTETIGHLTMYYAQWPALLKFSYGLITHLLFILVCFVTITLLTLL